MAIEDLASYRALNHRLSLAWAEFSNRREDALAPQRRFGVAAEKVAENILADLLTGPLDWPRDSMNYQVGYADMVITHLGIRRLVIELKRPDALAWNRAGVTKALDQARRYADEQGVKCIAVSDGRMLYAADIDEGGLRDRLLVDLASSTPPIDLWWLSRHGIYRQRQESEAALDLLRTVTTPAPPTDGADNTIAAHALLHPTYTLPARCFAYVPRADAPRSWKLPYRLADGSVDWKRLPKAIQAILTNYRGATVRSIPEPHIPAVLARLAAAATELGLMPPQAVNPAPVYRQLADTLEGFRRQA